MVAGMLVGMALILFTGVVLLACAYIATRRGDHHE